MTPIRPNKIHFIALPTEPASSKLLKTKIAAQAKALKITTSSFKPYSSVSSFLADFLLVSGLVLPASLAFFVFALLTVFTGLLFCPFIKAI